MILDRSLVIQWLINQFNFKTYLEIGVDSGKNFFPIKAGRKIAVDPGFRFNELKKLVKTVRYPQNLRSAYYRMESDRFFETTAAKALHHKPLDICLVDGMHEYAFALRDVENSLQHLSDGGVIIMHDCNPLSKEANYSWQEWRANKCEGSWNGDVWKTILHLRSTRNDINVFVLDCDHGLGIITKGKPEKPLSFTPEQIAALPYEELAANREAWLNLKPAAYLYHYFKP